MLPSHIHTESDVTAFWKAAMGELGFAGTRLYFVFVDEDGEVVPHLTALEDLPEFPDDGLIDNLCETARFLAEQAIPRGTVAALWARPGRGPMRLTDRLWARRLTEGLRRRRVSAWPVHFANDVYLRVVASDDLAA